MILADEGLNGNIVRVLRSEGHDVVWIKEVHPGMADEDIIKLAITDNKILITEDKDFGEWIFSHHLSGLTIIFLRYNKSDFELILNYLIRVLKSCMNSPQKEFITINKNKVRRRSI